MASKKIQGKQHNAGRLSEQYLTDIKKSTEVRIDTNNANIDGEVTGLNHVTGEVLIKTIGEERSFLAKATQEIDESVRAKPIVTIQKTGFKSVATNISSGSKSTSQSKGTVSFGTIDPDTSTGENLKKSAKSKSSSDKDKEDENLSECDEDQTGQKKPRGGTNFNPIDNGENPGIPPGGPGGPPGNNNNNDNLYNYGPSPGGGGGGNYEKDKDPCTYPELNCGWYPGLTCPPGMSNHGFIEAPEGVFRCLCCSNDGAPPPPGMGCDLPPEDDEDDDEIQTYDCIDGGCVHNIKGKGKYKSLAECMLGGAGRAQRFGEDGEWHDLYVGDAGEELGITKTNRTQEGGAEIIYQVVISSDYNLFDVITSQEDTVMVVGPIGAALQDVGHSSGNSVWLEHGYPLMRSLIRYEGPLGTFENIRIVSVTPLEPGDIPLIFCDLRVLSNDNVVFLTTYSDACPGTRIIYPCAV